MIKKNIFVSSSVLALILSSLALASAHGSRRSSSCDPWGRGYNPLHAPARRRYNYHRRPYDAIDIVSSIFSSPIMSSANANSMLRQSELASSRMVERSTPRYAIQDLNDTIELTMEVPGVKAEDIQVEVENESLLRIKGSRTILEHGSVSRMEFDQAFDIGSDISIPDIKVELSSGILRISAPKRKQEVKRIPVTVNEANDVAEVAVKESSTISSSKEEPKSDDKPEQKISEDDALTIVEDED